MEWRIFPGFYKNKKEKKTHEEIEFYNLIQD